MYVTYIVLLTEVYWISEIYPKFLISEPNKPQNLKFDIDKSNVLRVSWTTGVSVLDVFQTVTVLSNDTIVDNVETDYDTYINENLNANTLNTIEIFSSIKSYPNTTTSKSQHQLWTCELFF